MNKSAAKPIITDYLGPVDSLESYVKADWWREIFNANYLRTDGDVIDDQTITKSEIDLFSQILELKYSDSILDLCCGQGRHSLELARRGFEQVNGLDRSHYLIGRAKKSVAMRAFWSGSGKEMHENFHMRPISSMLFSSLATVLVTLNQMKMIKMF